VSEAIDAKATLRAELKRLRRAMAPEAREQHGEAIAQRVLQLPQWQEARVIFLYVAMGSEVQTRRLIEAALNEKKTLLLPRVIEAGVLEAIPVSDPEAGLTPGRFGIPAPNDPTAKPWDQPIDLVLCPGVAFTPTGQRLGQGGGYYDRFLDAHPCHHVVGLAYDEQVMDELPLEPHDVKIQGVVTPTRVLGVS